MKRSMKLLAGLAASAIVSSAQAVTVAGVTWDPDSIFDFSAVDTMIEKIVGAVGDELVGYARITTMNGEDATVFCASGCEVTYVFSGYTISSNTAGLSGADLIFSGGTISVYADPTPNYNSLLQSTAADGVLFLQLQGAPHYDVSSGGIGTLHSDPTPAAGTGLAGDGRGFLNVVGGAAAAYFNTNTFAIDTDGDGANDAFADFQFTSSFQLIPGGTFVSDDGVTYGIFGSNEIQGDSIRVPEPGTLSLFGLALLGAGALRRRVAR